MTSPAPSSDSQAMRRALQLCQHLSASTPPPSLSLLTNPTALSIHESKPAPSLPSSIPSSTSPSSSFPPSSSSTSSPPSPASSSSSPSSPSPSASSTNTPHPDSASASNRHWNGWGYRDTEFILTSSGDIALAGHRYAYSGKTMPHLRAWMEARTGIDVRDATPSQPEPTCPPPTLTPAFLSAISPPHSCHHVDTSDRDRLFHAHGHTAQEIFALRFGRLPRIPDAVVYPSTQQHVQAIVRAASQHDVCLIPYGGGTTVSQSLLCPPTEQRMIVSLDLHLLSSILSINRTNLTATIQAGAIGHSIERQLNAHQLTLGHEPDSMEFSSLGGWVATRASGMRKNRYGNIEDIVQGVTMVTADGRVLEKGVVVPRLSTGPDVHQVMLGSEGMLGVVTQAVVRVCDKPESVVYGSAIFPSYAAGVAALKEVQRMRLTPVSIRLVDNNQFQFGQALKVDNGDWKGDVMDKGAASNTTPPSAHPCTRLPCQPCMC